MLPAEAAELRRLTDAIRGVFDTFGYGEVRTPTLELETVMETAGEQRFRRSFRLFDERGEVLMLRPEMTTPIARLAATKLADREPPFRLCYFANSFRPTAPQRGRRSEFRQAGLELIGEDSPAADAEALAVLCRSLDVCGLDSYAIGLGEASFFTALLDSAGVDPGSRAAILKALVGRDMVELAAAVGALDLPDDDRENILAVTALRGGSEVLTRARDYVRGERMEEALRRLARTYYLVSRYGYGDRIIFDLGMFRNFDYYTGIVFEVYGGGLGFPLGGGGRYDGLLARFGRSAPAVGFAIGLDRLHIAAGDGAAAAPARTAVLVGGMDEHLDLAVELRDKGLRIFSLPAAADEAAARRAAGENGIGRAVVPAGNGFILLDALGETGRYSRAELIRELAD